MNSIEQYTEENKSYWGYGITAAYICFMVLILTLVFKFQSKV